MKKPKEEYVDILEPPTFKVIGKKLKEQAHDDHDWIATFNLWIIQSQPHPAIIYQKRGKRVPLAPSLLDVSAGGHYRSGEKLYDGLREVEEELGKKYAKKDIIFLGRRIYFDYDIKRRLRHNLVHVFITIDNTPLSNFKLAGEEVDNLYLLPINDLIKVHKENNYSFETVGINYQGKRTKFPVNKNSFTYNWDNYHLKIALLAKRLLAGEKDLFI